MKQKIVFALFVVFFYVAIDCYIAPFIKATMCEVLKCQ